jgi:hypothetical protein
MPAKKYVVKNNQNIIDVAIMMTGDTSAAAEICYENGIDINSPLDEGTELTYSGSIENKEVLKYIETNELVIATGR